MEPGPLRLLCIEPLLDLEPLAEPRVMLREEALIFGNSIWPPWAAGANERNVGDSGNTDLTQVPACPGSTVGSGLLRFLLPRNRSDTGYYRWVYHRSMQKHHLKEVVDSRN